MSPNLETRTTETWSTSQAVVPDRVTPKRSVSVEANMSDAELGTEGSVQVDVEPSVSQENVVTPAEPAVVEPPAPQGPAELKFLSTRHDLVAAINNDRKQSG